MASFKARLRQSFLAGLYLWLANRYRGFRRLYAYPSTAAVGAVDYDHYWDAKADHHLGELSPWRRRRAQAIAALVEPGDHVLDVGVGDGAILRYLIDRRSVVGSGLDVSPKAVEFCRAQGLDVHLADANRPLSYALNTEVDYIILTEVIEHLPDPESLLVSLMPLARKGLIVSIPNTGFHQHRLRLLLGRFPLQWVVTPGEHLRFWTRADFYWWARQLGFEIAREIPYEGTPGLRHAWPGLCAAGLIYLLRPAR